MKVMPKGDYYLWYCDWCDSKNLTIWTKVDSGRFCCSACQRAYGVESDGRINLFDADEMLLMAV